MQRLNQTGDRKDAAIAGNSVDRQSDEHCNAEDASNASQHFTLDWLHTQKGELLATGLYTEAARQILEVGLGVDVIDLP